MTALIYIYIYIYIVSTLLSNSKIFVYNYIEYTPTRVSAPNCLLFMLEKWKKCIGEKGSASILLTDLSKSFDRLIHDLLIAKLNAYGFDYNSIKLLYNYLTGRFQRLRINSNYRPQRKILFGVPQGSLVGPLLFNSYLSDLFLFCREFRYC